jgi:hypothetical protein
LLVLAATTALVQPAAAQTNPARKVLFTLNPGEAIYQTEYFANASFDGYKFAAVLHNAQTDEYTFVFNGKRIFTTDGSIEIPYINPNEENGYVYTYRLAGRIFINEKGKASRLEGCGEYVSIWNYDNGNVTYYCGERYARINGKTWGPYKYVSYVSVAGNGNFWFTYMDNDDKRYALINDKTWGPYNDVRDVSVAGNGNFGFVYWDNDDKRYARINDKTWGPYDEVVDVSVAGNGNFGFAYRDNDRKWYARINDKTWGPYDQKNFYGVGSVSVAGNGNFGFSYKDNDGKEYARINDKTWGPYNDVRDVSVAGNGNFRFAYRDNDGKWYARINDKTWGPYEGVGDVSMAGNGNFGFAYRDNDGKEYARINDKTWGPYNDVRDVSVADNGNFEFFYEGEDGYDHKNINGKESVVSSFKWIMDGWDGKIEGRTSTSATSSDGQHDFYSDLNYEYVVIDGRQVGRSPALRVWYDKQSHSFVWNAIEEKELVVYEYKL